MAISLQVASAVRVTVRGTAYLPSPAIIAEGTAQAAAFALAASGSAATATTQAGIATTQAGNAATTAASLSAALGASFITSAAEASLSGERVLTDSATVTFDRSVAGQISATAAAAANGSITAVKLATSAIGVRAGMVNGTLVQSRASSAETFAIKTLAGTDPTSSDPVYFVFRTAAGGFVVRTITAALSVTVSNGSTLGATNSVPFRIWCVAADDAGTVRLGVVKAVGGTSPSISVLALNEWNTFSSTAEGGAGAADSAQVIYSGTAFTSRYICLVGFGDWDSGLAAVGTWGTAPTRTVLFGPGVPTPGSLTGNRSYAPLVSTFSSATTGALTDITGLTTSITPASAANLVRAVPRVCCQASASNQVSLVLLRGSTQIGGGTSAGSRPSSFGGLTRSADTNAITVLIGDVLDAPGAVTAQTYKVQFGLQGGTFYVNRTETDTDAVQIGRYASAITLDEVMA